MTDNFPDYQDMSTDIKLAAVDEAMGDFALPKPYESEVMGALHSAYPVIARWVTAQARASAFREAADLVDEHAKRDGVLGPTDTDLDASILRGLAGEAEAVFDHE